MNKLVTVRDFLKSYNITKDVLMEEVNKDKSFYDKYIEWEKLDADSIITPKALDRLGKVFNEPAPEMTITRNGEVSETVSLDPSTPLKPKRKRRTKAEIEADNKKENGEQIDMSEFMDTPAVSEDNKIEEIKEKPSRKKTVKMSDSGTAPRKKKSKLNITKQFIQEHGQADVGNSDALKQLRKFLMNDGSRKVEEVALMTDEEVQAAFGKDFYVIEAEEGTYFIKRTVLTGNMSDIYVVEKE